MKKSLVNVTTHSGKMEGIPPISTSCILNARCQKRVNCDKSVCYKCFAHSYMSFRKSLREAMERNFHILTERLITKKEIEDLNINSSFFRFEAFGDLNNNIQLINRSFLACCIIAYLFCYCHKDRVIREFLLFASQIVIYKR